MQKHCSFGQTKEIQEIQDLVSSHRSIYYIQNDQLRKNITLFSKTSPLEFWTWLQLHRVNACLALWCVDAHCHIHTTLTPRTDISLPSLKFLLPCHTTLTPRTDISLPSLKFLLPCHTTLTPRTDHLTPFSLTLTQTCYPATGPPTVGTALVTCLNGSILLVHIGKMLLFS